MYIGFLWLMIEAPKFPTPSRVLPPLSSSPQSNQKDAISPMNLPRKMSKGVRFQEDFITCETFSPCEYDRTPTPATPVNYKVMLEIMRLRVELREQGLLVQMLPDEYDTRI
jgi:hypothetical protein